jgi:DNA helicase-2/ATP-dependent DNA helicase PcrA
MPRTWSPQQEAVFTAIRNRRGGSLRIRAVAGAGKTSTLVEACDLMSGSVAFCAYNKKIADEIKAKTAHLNHVHAGTFHSFGLSAWMRYKGQQRSTINAKKLELLQKDLGEVAAPVETREFARSLVSLAKQSGFGILEPVENIDRWFALADHFDVLDKLPDGASDATLHNAIHQSQSLLSVSNRCEDIIDFDDMIYLPVLRNVRIWQNDWVLVDEAQDTNPIRRAMARKMLRPGGRLVAVGDPHQAIYGFTGADNDALDLIATEFNCQDLPLTVTYRCPKSVVAFAQNWVSHITAAETAPEGTVSLISLDQLLAGDLRPTDAILCRNTAPLVELAFSLIKRGIGCRVEGKDIGNGLMALANRWKKVKTVGALATKLEDYREKQVQRYMAKGQEMKAASLVDRVDALMTIIESLPTDAPISDIKLRIQAMFGDNETDPRQLLTLSTVHKSKGREWPRVYLLGRSMYMPSPFARQVWQAQQEDNLIYVAVTRAQADLIEVELPPKSRQPR